RIVVHELFSDRGLVIIDADNKHLKKLFIPVMKDDAENQTAFTLVNETISELGKKYKSQVHPREINLFYLDVNYRKRLISNKGSFEVIDTDLRFNKEELFREMESHPEKFSPNVVLRPLYQEKILPNIAYVGGPAEVAYWLEYKKMFEHYGVKLPVLVLRNCLTIVDSDTQNKLTKVGFEPEDIFMTEEELIKKHLRTKQTPEFSIESLLKKTDELFNEAGSQVDAIDPTLKASVEAEKQKIQNSLRMLEEKIRRAEKKKHETTIGQVKRLKEKLFPENKL